MKNKINPEILQFVTDVAFVGIERGYFKEANEILSAVLEVCPNDVNAKTTQAVAHVFMGQLVQGVKELFEILKKDPKNEIVKGFLAVAFKLGHVDNQALNLSQQILEHSDNEIAKDIAQGILEDYKNHISPHALQAELCANLSK
jgi:hypothetical protein